MSVAEESISVASESLFSISVALSGPFDLILEDIACSLLEEPMPEGPGSDKSGLEIIRRAVNFGFFLRDIVLELDRLLDLLGLERGLGTGDAISLLRAGGCLLLCGRELWNTNSSSDETSSEDKLSEEDSDLDQDSAPDMWSFDESLSSSTFSKSTKPIACLLVIRLVLAAAAFRTRLLLFVVVFVVLITLTPDLC